MEEHIAKALAKEDAPLGHAELLQHCMSLIRVSRTKMSDKYTTWDYHDSVFRGEIAVDDADKQASKRKEPTKMIIPLAYSQVMTFVSFAMAMHAQNQVYFPVNPINKDSVKGAQLAEALIERDLNFNNFEGKLYQYYLDLAIRGLAVTKVCWDRQTSMVRQTKTIPAPSFFGVKIGKDTYTEETIEQVKYEGNKVENVSPYRFYPDTRLPLQRFQEGEFCGSEDEYSYSTLKALEYAGVCAGIDHVPMMRKQDLTDRRDTFRYSSTDVADEYRLISPQSKANIIITEIQMNLIPSKYEFDGQKVGPEDHPVKYVVWYANDQRIIKLEPLNYLHNNFTYYVGQYAPDQHRLLCEGLSGSIGPLQDAITWFVNSRITSVRKMIGTKVVVDPTGVNMKDLQERSPVIRLTPAAQAQGGVDKFIKQLDLQDVTTNHINLDVPVLKALLQEVSGINDNTLGTVNSGRRSAREVQATNSAAANRIRTIIKLNYKSTWEPMINDMISNSRDGLDTETWVKVRGQLADADELTGYVKMTKNDLIGNFDFSIFDASLPSERDYQANTLQELLTAMLANPNTIPMFGYDPVKVAKLYFELKGIKNADVLKLDQVRQQELMTMIQTLERNGPTINGRTSADVIGTPPVSSLNGGGGQPNPGGAINGLSGLVGAAVDGGDAEGRGGF